MGADRPGLIMRHLTRATTPWEPTGVATASVDDAATLLASVSSTVVLTGAGISTDSGVPDYRGPGAPQATPMMYAEFVGDQANRRRYWARSYIGWTHMGHAAPNAGHRALAAWEQRVLPTRLVGVISQNVDGLHSAAGQRRLIELHGRIRDVRCLGCGEVSSRAALQERLHALNADLPDTVASETSHPELRPDGDAVVDEWAGFVVPACERCGGVLKPDVVFFGECVPRPIVEQATAWVEQAESLLVLGSSLTVMSGLRFVRHAARRGVPIVIVNRGATRGDELADVRLDAGCTAVLQALVGDAGS